MVEEFSAQDWDRVIAINLSAAFHTIRLAVPSMKSRNWGRIINVSSVHGLVASPQKSAYGAWLPRSSSSSPSPSLPTNDTFACA